jgi:hypothetical protein
MGPSDLVAARGAVLASFPAAAMWERSQISAPPSLFARRPSTPGQRADADARAAPVPSLASRGGRRLGRRRAPAMLAAAALALPSLARLSPPAALVPSASLVALAAGACRRPVESDRRAQLGAEAEWRWLLQAKRRLDDKRASLARAPADPLAREVEALSQELARRLVVYVNANPPLEGTPLSERQLAAIRMKSDEDIAVAHQFIDRAGDYRRACEIYEAALADDPRNPRLREELARAQAARYMTAERFSRAAPGMSAAAVRAALGPPNAHDVRSYPDKRVVAWFYPRDASGAAAAVWFEKGDGGLTVYLCDWSALEAAAPPAKPGSAAPPPHPAPADSSTQDEQDGGGEGSGGH